MTVMAGLLNFGKCLFCSANGVFADIAEGHALWVCDLGMRDEI